MLRFKTDEKMSHFVILPRLASPDTPLYRKQKLRSRRQQIAPKRCAIRLALEKVYAQVHLGYARICRHLRLQAEGTTVAILM